MPLVLVLRAAGSRVGGTASIDLGTQLRTSTVSGRVAPDGSLTFDADVFTFVGSVTTDRIAGTYRAGRRELQWSVHRVGD